MAATNPMDNARFADFKIIPATYKKVQDHRIAAYVLIPKTLLTQPDASKKYPVILRVHGGGLVTGASLFPDWFPKWALELASQHSAIIISPNHRLLPESSVGDVLEDMEDFWTWVQEKAPTFVAGQTDGAVHIDTSRILTAGESAGGLLSLHLGLSHPDQIRAVTAAYPMIDSKSEHFRTQKKAPIGIFPYIPESIIEAHRNQLENGELPSVVSEDEGLERVQLMVSLIQNGGFKELFPWDRREWHLLDRMEDGARFPRGGLFVWHGENDSIVPVEGSRKFADMVQRVDPSLNFRLAVREGEHGFDEGVQVDDEWFADGMRDLVAVWLSEERRDLAV